MQIKITKINCGLRFEVTGRSKKDEREVALNHAGHWYKGKVMEYLKIHAMDETGYARTFFNQYPGWNLKNREEGQKEVIWETEIWGFAQGTFEHPEMVDSGSTPSDFRARFLLALQSPLKPTKNGFAVTLSYPPEVFEKRKLSEHSPYKFTHCTLDERSALFA